MEDVSLWYGLALTVNVLFAMGLGYLVVERYVFNIDTIQPGETFDSEDEKQTEIRGDNRGALIISLVIMGITGLIAVFAGLGPFVDVWGSLAAVAMLDAGFVLSGVVIAFIFLKAKKVVSTVLRRGSFSSRGGQR